MGFGLIMRLMLLFTLQLISRWGYESNLQSISQSILQSILDARPGINAKMNTRRYQHRGQ